MDFRILGPLEVSDQEHALALGGLKQRSLLALLVLHANEIVATDRLIVQRSTGVVAEPLLGRPGHDGIVGLARGAGVLVIGLSDRWREEGLGAIRSRLVAAAPAPTVLVRRAAARAGLAPDDPRTLFRWSLIEAGT